MSFDFQAGMVLALAITGAIWAFDALRLRPQREAAAQKLQQSAGEAAVDPERMAALRKQPVLVEYARSFFPIILVVLVLRSFLIEPFRIPSGSMMPTLLAGDFILVNKYSYGIRLPVIDTKIIEVGSPERGDIAVFRYPEDPSVDYIKRIVGLPGDRIRYENKTLFINGVEAPQSYLGEYTGVGVGRGMSGASLRKERIDDNEHQILVQHRRPLGEGEFVVPEGQYFAMGDNRDNSNDSRFWGPVPEKHLVGRAFMIWMSWDSAGGGVNWSRIGTQLQ
ncbi:MAG: signal peptidase I [Gammaproteobacteria bacterium]|jgi:signal peptidase I|nr:signal peptidase I [Gammaproteobacteria bacterium]